MRIERTVDAPAYHLGGERPTARGKFLFLGDEKLSVRGVTYGTFRPDAGGNEYGSPAVIDRDFGRMAANGFNAVRTYTVPPRRLLDLAARHGLHVMVGLPWEEHITFLDDRRRAREIAQRVGQAAGSCAGHPALLCYTIGNEIPAPIVRWHGAQRVEAYLARLYHAVKDEDPAALVTYVNYPSTEYLQLPFLDLVAFNLYLESQDRLEAYLARLQNIAGDRPLLMAEIGLDSRRHGEDRQAEVLGWQVRTALAAGCAGAFTFAWTDEWHRGGHDVDDWDFGLTRRDGTPKPALEAVRQAYADGHLPPAVQWPRVSVVVCTYNGARTIADCCRGLLELSYPDFEVIVVDDGSTDETAAIVRAHGLRVISTPNGGLSAARNTGVAAASGEIVAFTDDDAHPDPHWLTYLATRFLRGDVVGVGGPNIPPEGEGWVATCVANAPGGPVHVLLSDQIAEHIPGCNMAFRRDALEAIGGFDPRFHAAGDDVDVCWRLQDRGWQLGFQPAAVVWHRRRDSIRTYWKQQKGYGKAEALLEAKWPERYNSVGHLTWGGRLYGRGLTLPLLWRRGRIYAGPWGSAPFQSLHESPPGMLRSLPLMPEWYLVILSLAGLVVLGALWRPLLLTLPFLAAALIVPLLQACLSACRCSFGQAARTPAERLKLRTVTAFLHVLQPLARLHGRLNHGLTPWRSRGLTKLMLPWPRMVSVWSEVWRSADAWLHTVEAGLREDGAVVERGGDFDRWDLAVRGGALGRARTLMVLEEHGAGKQLARFRITPRPSRLGVVLVTGLSLLVLCATVGRARLAGMELGLLDLVAGIWLFRDCAAATALLYRRVAPSATEQPIPGATGSGARVPRLEGDRLRPYSATGASVPEAPE